MRQPYQMDVSYVSYSVADVKDEGGDVEGKKERRKEKIRQMCGDSRHYNTLFYH